MSEISEGGSAPIPDSPTPATTPAESPTSTTVLGKDRAQWDAEMQATRGAAWMEANRAMLDTQWRDLVATFGD